jgi:hypothetical protein
MCRLMLSTTWCIFIYNAQTLITGILAILAAAVTVWATLRSAKINAKATLDSAVMMMAHNSEQIAIARAVQDMKDSEARSAAARELVAKLISLKDCIDPTFRPSPTGAFQTYHGRAVALFPGIEGVRLFDAIEQARLIGGAVSQEYGELIGWVSEVVSNDVIGNLREKFLAEGVEIRARAERLERNLNDIACHAPAEDDSKAL